LFGSINLERQPGESKGNTPSSFAHFRSNH
jgi:hypothetical protein